MLQQFMTFYIDEQLYGMDVMNIQEVTKKVKITPLMRSMPEIIGLMNWGVCLIKLTKCLRIL